MLKWSQLKVINCCNFRGHSLTLKFTAAGVIKRRERFIDFIYLVYGTVSVAKFSTFNTTTITENNTKMYRILYKSYNHNCDPNVKVYTIKPN